MFFTQISQYHVLYACLYSKSSRRANARSLLCSAQRALWVPNQNHILFSVLQEFCPWSWLHSLPRVTWDLCNCYPSSFYFPIDILLSSYPNQFPHCHWEWMINRRGDVSRWKSTMESKTPKQLLNPSRAKSEAGRWSPCLACSWVGLDSPALWSTSIKTTFTNMVWCLVCHETYI